MKTAIILLLSVAFALPVLANTNPTPKPRPRPAAARFADSDPRVGDFSLVRTLTRFRVTRPKNKPFEFAPREVADLMMPAKAPRSIRPQSSSDFPRAEFFAGFAYTSIDTKNSFGSRSHAYGWNIGITGNFTRSFAMVADVAGVYGNRDVFIPRGSGFVPVQLNYTGYTIMGGPQFTARGERVSPFIRAMGGVAILDFEGEDDNAPAFSVGGGFDVKLNDRISWRVFQGDYILTRFEEADANLILRRQTQHNFKVATGLVFR